MHDWIERHFLLVLTALLLMAIGIALFGAVSSYAHASVPPQEVRHA